MYNFTIRLLTVEDTEVFFELIQNNKSRLEDFFAGTIKYTQTKESTLNYCKTIESKIKQRAYYPYLIFNNEELIGFIDFKNIDWSIPKAELGAFIDINFEGKGIITKSFTTLLESVVKTHGFKKLFCRISQRNVKSIALAERCGFCLEGTITKDYRTTNGELIDLNYYGKQL
ncbi:GNAT family N-acetyltransferase [Tenacibaculum jejuense]|uniref:Ribosomal-protein-serine N-acetyltransferase n=1 Tax=Tenacibaculum jejuense TaxID=584609 RepID=A0A238U7N9_9FLAO|nr:GNAT family N-acetyltransferase [Tenacibaculum jejuense]SNR15203.1 Ribosomal-protein-serine N-acetyltransferase [Tenacibaculum jejuense]